jgi:hypothetical protein
MCMGNLSFYFGLSVTKKGIDVFMQETNPLKTYVYFAVD